MTIPEDMKIFPDLLEHSTIKAAASIRQVAELLSTPEAESALYIRTGSQIIVIGMLLAAKGGCPKMHIARNLPVVFKQIEEVIERQFDEAQRMGQGEDG